jgi:hydrogenase maturation protease
VAEGWTVVGLGNPLRGDDGVGTAVAARTRHLPGVERVVEGIDPLDLVDLLHESHPLVLIDATQGGGAPGTVTVWDPRAQGLPRPRVGASSHGFGAENAVELAVALGARPRRVVFVGIEAERFDAAGLSAAVEAAVESAVAGVAKVVADA